MVVLYYRHAGSFAIMRVVHGQTLTLSLARVATSAFRIKII